MTFEGWPKFYFAKSFEFLTLALENFDTWFLNMYFKKFEKISC